MKAYSASGEIKSAAPVSVLTLPPGSIPYNLLQDASQGAVLGRGSAGSGAVELVSLDPATMQLPANGTLRSIYQNYLIAEHLEHMFQLATPSGYAFTVSGTGSAGALKAPEAAAPGIIRLQRGTTTTGRAALAAILANYGPDPSGGTITYECRFRLNQLSDGTNRFNVRIGWLSAVTGVPVNGSYVEYVDNVNSGAWVLTNRAASVSTTTNGSAGPSASTWTRLKMVFTSGTMEAFQDDSSLGIVFGGAPTLFGGQGAGIFGSLGTTDCTLDVDYIYWSWRP